MVIFDPHLRHHSPNIKIPYFVYSKGGHSRGSFIDLDVSFGGWSSIFFACGSNYHTIASAGRVEIIGCKIGIAHQFSALEEQKGPTNACIQTFETISFAWYPSVYSYSNGPMVGEHQLDLLGGSSSIIFFTIRKKANSNMGSLPSVSYSCSAFLHRGDCQTTSFS